MAEWQQVYQSIFIGFIFSFLLAKLFSVIFAFRDENLRVVRSHSVEPETEPEPELEPTRLDPSSYVLEENEPIIAHGDDISKNDDVVISEKEPLIGDSEESDDDWEGVESTELDEMFSAAIAFVAATAADRGALKVSNEVQLQLYGFYKIATEGPCTAPQPSALKMSSRAKWQAWKKLGSMAAEEAMQKYIDIVSEIHPSWASGSTSKTEEEIPSDAPTSGSSGPMGPVFSTFIYNEEEQGSELKLEAIHAFSREGDEVNVLKCLDSGVPVNLKDSEGRTPLHWAVDRGHLKVAETLLKRNADVNAKDNEGQTALHYAAVCERATIAQLLVQSGANILLTDNEGDAPKDLCSSTWSGLALLVKSTD